MCLSDKTLDYKFFSVPRPSPYVLAEPQIQASAVNDALQGENSLKASALVFFSCGLCAKASSSISSSSSQGQNLFALFYSLLKNE